MFDRPLPSLIDLAIVGAGPQALTLVTHILQKRQKFRNRFMVLDPSGTWLEQWRHQFKAQEIPHLRSPAVHHPDPDPYSLRRFAENRSMELFPPYDLPGTELFEDFCGEVVKKWELTDRVYPGKVSQVLPIQWSQKPRFQIVLTDGSSLIARRVVLATGAAVPNIPQWVEEIRTPYPPSSLCHSQQVDLRLIKDLSGEDIVIVGGGLTSGHLAMGALKRGAMVTLVVRRQLRERLFDAEPGWLGPKYLKGFEGEDCWYRRWEMIKQARDGGSVTPALMLQLRRAARQGKLRILENTEILGALWKDEQWRVRLNGEVSLMFNRIWLATGTQFNGHEDNLLTDVLRIYRTEMINGLPVLDENLRIPGSECFIMGGLAALIVGPVARNLSGGRMASDRLVKAIIKPNTMLPLGIS
ncbi:FAD/NAD(P)-binding protein [Limnospira fusiformis]|uniref:FAD/NAD(P)-binding protein n=1 Tax=Limnospira fusiformis TaxID=54297 RepID=UPI0034E0D43B